MFSTLDGTGALTDFWSSVYFEDKMPGMARGTGKIRKGPNTARRAATCIISPTVNYCARAAREFKMLCPRARRWTLVTMSCPCRRSARGDARTILLMRLGREEVEFLASTMALGQQRQRHGDGRDCDVEERAGTCVACVSVGYRAGGGRRVQYFGYENVGGSSLHFFSY